MKLICDYEIGNRYSYLWGYTIIRSILDTMIAARMCCCVRVWSLSTLCPRDTLLNSKNAAKIQRMFRSQVTDYCKL